MRSIPAACAEQAQMRDWEEIGELGRGSNGVVEVKFTDRMGIIAALMERCQEDPTEALLRQLGGTTDE